MTILNYNAGKILQQAIFKHLEKNKSLIASFRPYAQTTAQLPQFSFDSIESKIRDTELQLVDHEINFSAWAEIQAVADASDIENQLVTHMKTKINVTKQQIIRLEHTESIGKEDRTMRLWRLKIKFIALTQSGEN